MANITYEMEKLLAKLSQEQDSANKEMKTCRKVEFICQEKRRRHRFFRVDEKRTRKSINKDENMIRALARKKYLHKQLELLAANQRAVEEFLMRYTEATADEILERLPKPIRPYCFSHPDRKGRWGDGFYRQSDYMPEKKIHTTSKGLKVRSKSEVLIAEKLYEHNIEFRYEQILQIEQMEFAPDFTIMADDGRLIYWEHCGLTGSKKYMDRHKRKLEIYERADIAPWTNLIITYDDQYGNINMNVVESEIKCKIKGGAF